MNRLRFIAASMAGASRSALRRSRSASLLLELGHHVGGEELERLADVLVAIAAALLDEDHLVDADVGELAQVRRAASPGVPMPPSIGPMSGIESRTAFEALPDVRPPGLVVPNR